MTIPLSEPPLRPHDLGAIIGRVQSRYIRAAPPREVFEPLLTDLLDWTGSEYGFMAEVLHDARGEPFLRIEVLTDIAWDDATRARFERHQRGGPNDALEFHNLRTLFGAGIVSGEVVISNDPGRDARRGGLPSGHPPMNAFLGVPLFHGGEMVGMLGLANREGGYDQAMVDHLQPLFTSVAAIFGAVRSERERHAAAQALRAQQEQLQTTFDLAGVGIVQIGLDGAPRMINQRLCELLGRTQEEQLAQRTVDVTHPDDLALELEQRARLLRGEVAQYRSTKRYRHADGHWVWVNAHTTLVRKPDGSPDYFIGVAEDITERRQAEAALRSSQQRFLDLVKSVDGIFWEADLEARCFTYVSERAEAITGYPVSQWLEQNFWSDHVHPDDRDRAMREVIAAQVGGSAQAIEYRFIARDGRVLWMSSLITVMHAAEGGRPLLRGLIIDTSARKRAEDAELAAEAALRANAAKTEFLSRMSHELRTPLNAVLGFSQLMALDSSQPLSPSQQARVQHISQAGAHLLAMINDVLDLSRIESGGVALLPTTVPVHIVVNEALAMVAPAAASAGVSVQVDRLLPARSHITTCVRADHLRLRQVLVNLLSNAIKYNRPGGSVMLRWPVDAAAGQVYLQVEDTGLGLTAKQQEHLFEPFNRLGLERSGIEGTGIGLVITRRLLQLMGGELSVQSRVGEGSCFTASMPLAHATGVAPAGAAADAPGAPPATPPYDVLYAEDNPVNVELVRQVLKMRPACRLRVASNGEQALRLAAQARPDLMLVDMHLGDMSGLDLARHLARDPGLSTVPRIVLSADASPDQTRAAMAAGFAAYLTKPLNVAQLLRHIDEQQGRTPE